MASTKFKWHNEIKRYTDHAVLLISKTRDDEYFEWKVIIDLEDVESVNLKPWRLDTHGYVAYWQGGREDREFCMLHRFVTDAADGIEVDHIDHDLMNNRKENLRMCNSRSCVMLNTKRARLGVNFNNYKRDGVYVTLFTNVTKPKQVAIAKFNSPAEALEYAAELRKTDYDPVELLYDYEINRKHENKLHHIQHLYPNFWRVQFFSTPRWYKGVKSEAEAIAARNQKIREWCESLFAEG